MFSYRGVPVKKLHSSAWRRAWKKAGLPVEDGVLKGVHNLRHSFGRRLHGASGLLEIMPETGRRSTEVDSLAQRGAHTESMLIIVNL